MSKNRSNQRYKNEIYEELKIIIGEMNDNIDAIVVEGPNDKLTLEILGFKNPILLCSMFSYNKLADQSAKEFSNVSILTDYDEEGQFKKKKLLKIFESRGIKVDRYYRKKIKEKLLELRILNIEGMRKLKI